MRLDHPDQFLDHVHIGGFERALLQAAKSVQAGRARLRGAACRRLQCEVLAACLQASRVDEIDELQRANLGRRRLSGHLDTDRAVAADRD